MVSHKDEKLSNYNGCSLKALYYYTQGNDMASSFLNFRKSAEAFKYSRSSLVISKSFLDASSKSISAILRTSIGCVVFFENLLSISSAVNFIILINFNKKMDNAQYFCYDIFGYGKYRYNKHGF